MNLVKTMKSVTLTINALESFVRSAYCPRGVAIGNIPELRWYLFCKPMAESDRLPPTLPHAITLSMNMRSYKVSNSIFLDPY